MELEDIQVINNSQASRFEIRLGDDYAYSNYRLESDMLDIVHTYVPPQYRGHELAARLTEAALGFARKKNIKVKPTCSYVSYYLRKHGDQYQDVMK